mgnify:CR=1 FL=1
MEVYLVTDYLENAGNLPLEGYPRGSFRELEALLNALHPAQPGPHRGRRENGIGRQDQAVPLLPQGADQAAPVRVLPQGRPGSVKVPGIEILQDALQVQCLRLERDKFDKSLP